VHAVYVGSSGYLRIRFDDGSDLESSRIAPTLVASRPSTGASSAQDEMSRTSLTTPRDSVSSSTRRAPDQSVAGAKTRRNWSTSGQGADGTRRYSTVLP
jgi:hypothetical protein